MQQEKKFDFNQTIGFILIAILFGVFYFLNKPSEEQIEAQKKELVQKQQEAKKHEQLNNTASQQAFQAVDPTLAQDVEVSNDKLKVKFSPKGAQISDVEIIGFDAYDAKKDGNKDPLHLVKNGSSKFNLSFKTKQGTVLNVADLVFVPQVQKNANNTVITFTANAQNSQIQYIYTLGDAYGIDFEVKTQGLSNITAENKVDLAWTMDAFSTEKGKDQEKYWSHTYFQFKGNKDIEYELFGADEWNEEESISWVANKQQFFASVLSYDEGFKNTNGGSKNSEKEDLTYSKHFHLNSQMDLKNSEMNYKFTWDFIPLDYKMLKGYNDKGFQNLIDFGWGLFGWLNKYFFLNIFKWLASVGITYGWVIFLMTIVVKLILSPVMYKQYRQSALMKVVRPELNAINDKYKDSKDAMKKQQETMEIYRTAGINPLAGCLPALLQIPIFYALFRFFPNLIDLRGVPFWFVDDLTAYDDIIRIPEWVPLLNGHLSIFAVLYIVAMMVYFKISGSMDNFQMPQQEGMPNMQFMKYMMYIMPVFFFVFLNNYASGLSWYYLVSNTINIFIVLYIKKFMIHEAKIQQIIETNKTKPKKQGKFASKMQNMMQQAQEMQNQQKDNKKK
ncbi:YidC/Oxa1 family membrane protein insertase [Algoriella xinjiangensis]|uniref:Membrane protein insertase YidC n=1 Tax=Algoriella xinjiangensis TaxID=684065 RepID=A0A1I4VIC1_9FLAO|nr:membrane protein insertase YidC [Algoriella xinjiangensis]SFN00921.1 YidC/Oxa1 family membrane protein insertase [Algoriella xinjiangensis]VDH17187.1 Oxa1Ec [Algoriella xinjiangensis]